MRFPRGSKRGERPSRRREAAERDPADGRGSGEGQQRPPRERRGARSRLPGGEGERRNGEKRPQRLSSEGAVRHAEASDEAKQVPVQPTVHLAECSRARSQIGWRANGLGTILSLLFVLFFLVPPLQRWALTTRRARAISALQRDRHSRVIALIHRQETVGFLGVPLYRFIDIEDSEAILRAIRLTPDETPDRPRPAHAGRARPRLRADRARAEGAPGEGHRPRAPLRDVRRHAHRPRRGRDPDGRGRGPRARRPAARGYARGVTAPGRVAQKPVERTRRPDARSWPTSPRRRSGT